MMKKDNSLFWKKIKNIFYRYRRYLLFLIEYYLLEKPRGLDFTMRDLTLMNDSDGILSGYSKINERHLHQILRHLIRLLDEVKCECFLDIGCGKGVVLKEAIKYPFMKVAGIEIQGNLVEIARKNFRILHIENKTECILADALKFDDYGSYSIFFFFNPFGKDIFAKVIERIVMQNQGQNKKIYLIYHNPLHKQVIEDMGYFQKEFTMFDTLKQYETCVYSSII